MTTLTFFLKNAWRNLWRGGQRVLVALLCIAFGVMSLASLTMVSQALDRAMPLAPAEQIGADLSLGRQDGQPLSAEDIAALDRLQASGEISRYTLIAMSGSLTFRLPDSGELGFSTAGMGIDPAVYPLAGALVLARPTNVGLATLLQQPGDLVITRDLADQHGLNIGSRLVLADLEIGSPVEGQVRGIASDTPNHQGSKIYYTLETAGLLAGRREAANTATANTPQPEALADMLNAAGYSAFAASVSADNSASVQQLFDLMLRGSGLLGLLVGGIGVANTMQVLLRRRRREAAIWKALGYNARALQAMFLIEAAWLGGAGSLLGIILGLAVSFGLLRLVTDTSNLLVQWTFSPATLALSGLVGVLTSVIFAAWSIVEASHAQPMALLRGETPAAARLPRLQSAGLLGLLILPFTGVAALAMGSLLKGLGVLLFAAAGLVVLGGLLGSAVRLAARLLPVRALPLARMAQTRLRRRSLGLVFAMIAIFTGVLAMGLGVVMTYSASDTMSRHAIEAEGDNLHILASAGQEDRVRQVLAKHGLPDDHFGVHASVQAIRTAQGDDPSLDLRLIGRSEPGQYRLEGAAWGSRPEGVYVPRWPEGVYVPRSSVIPIGSHVRLTLQDGSTRDLEVVGAYEIDFGLNPLGNWMGLLAPAHLVSQLAPPQSVAFSLRAPEAQLDRLSRSLGQALPSAMVINMAAYLSAFTRAYHNLFVLAMAMAGLALLAGVLLVANSVSLAMLDRRYEIGVLKAVGYTRGHILASLGVEYSLVALVATLAGLAGVQAALLAIGWGNELARRLLVLAPQSALLIGLCGVGLTLLTVIGVTWASTKGTPSYILNDRD